MQELKIGTVDDAQVENAAVEISGVTMGVDMKRFKTK